MLRGMLIAAFAACLVCLTLPVYAAEEPERTSTPNCKDENGKSVDWWVILKQPDGTNYVYYDPNTQSLNLSRHDLSSKSTGALAQTLSRMYSRSLGRIMYDDETPGGKKSTSKAHAKGVFARNTKGGVWLIHSTPKFPNPTSYTGYGAPASTKYGQSFLCVTLRGNTDLENVAYQLLIDNVDIYKSNVPSSLSSGNAPNFVSLAAGNHLKSPDSSIKEFTIGGLSFTSFARRCAVQDPLYENLVASHFRTGLMTETWQNGVGKTPSWCKPEHDYNVENIVSITAGYKTWTSTKDHSKWAIAGSASRRASKKVVCIGDMNRQNSQEHRGGGTMCILGDDNLYNAFYNIITEVKEC